MANKSQESKSILPSGARLVDKDRIQIEFLIEDLVKHLATDRIRQIAACNGCANCSANLDVVNPPIERK